MTSHFSNQDFSNEDLSIITSLNEAYNNNLRSIQIFTNSINDLTDMNVQIHNRIVDILNIRNIRETNRGTNRGTNRESNRGTNRGTNTATNTATNTGTNRETNRGTTRNNLSRVILNNIPYIIDSVQHYRIPSTSQREQSEETRNNNFINLLQRFLQPVEIFPTQSQIEAATRNVRYCDIVNPINRSCPISLENFSDYDNVTVIRHCGHIFNRQELITWFRSNCRCPICRYDIRNYNSNSNYFDLSGNVSIDTSNNLVNEQHNNYHESIYDESIDDENINQAEVERSIEEPINNNINYSTRRSNNGTTYFDLFFSDNALLRNNFSTLSDITDPNALLNMLRDLQPRSHR